MSGKVKVDGDYKKIAKVWAKEDGQWKRVNKAYAKEDGTWKQLWRSGYDRPDGCDYPVIIIRGDIIIWFGSFVFEAHFEVQVRYNGGSWSTSFFFESNTGQLPVSDDIKHNSFQMRIRAVAPGSRDQESAWVEGPIRSLTPQTLPLPGGLTYPSNITRGQKIRIGWNNASELIKYMVDAVYTDESGTQTIVNVYNGSHPTQNYADYEVSADTRWKKVHFQVRSSRVGYYDSPPASASIRDLLNQALGKIPSTSYPSPFMGQNLTLSWDTVPKAQQYQVEVLSPATGTWNRVYWGTNRSFTDMIPNMLGDIQYRVRATAQDYADGEWTYGTKYQIGLPPLKTSTWTATSVNTWKASQWMNDDYLYQGAGSDANNTKGLAFFDYSSIKNTLTGKIIEKVELYVYRVNADGAATSQQIDIHTHNFAALPPATSSPAITHLQGPLGSYPKGYGAWLTVNNALITKFLNDTAKGISLFRSDGGGYMKVSSNIQIKVSYR